MGIFLPFWGLKIYIVDEKNIGPSENVLWCLNIFRKDLCPWKIFFYSHKHSVLIFLLFIYVYVNMFCSPDSYVCKEKSGTVQKYLNYPYLCHIEFLPKISSWTCLHEYFVGL